MRPAVILISGVGQLGSRHLQGLARSARPLQIHLHDVSAASLETALGRWREVAAADSVHQVRLHNDFATFPKSIDIVIVATTAGVRPEVVRAITQQAKVGGWVLEKVLAQSEAGLEDLLELAGQGARAWVNTPRRTLPWHKQIKANLSTNSSLHLTVSGCEWGLACNSVHFLDMLSWWSGETLVEIRTDHLHSRWCSAKRPGNYEIMGAVCARFSGGSTAMLQVGEGELQYTFELNDGDLIWHMDETAGTATRSDGLSVPGRLPFQSEMTTGLVDTILATGTCELPTLRESIDLHRVLVASLLAHWRKSGDNAADRVPIT